MYQLKDNIEMNKLFDTCYSILTWLMAWGGEIRLYISTFWVNELELMY